MALRPLAALPLLAWAAAAAAQAHGHAPSPRPAAALEAAPAEPAGAARGTLALGDDPALAALVAEALERSPELARARAAVEADRERAPQAGAMPDPTLSFGIQNDGFQSIQIGTMETSYWQIMATQPLPWPGKLGKREDAARAQSLATEAQVDRVRLSVAAEVERAYLDLLLVRDQLLLQQRLETLWREAEAVARARYEVGQAAQSDLLRAQLERTRLQQQRIALGAAEQGRVQTLNRLRARPLDEPIATARSLRDLSDPPLAAADATVADAEARSPDLAQARRSVDAAQRRVASAERDRYPDFSVTAGIMPRGSIEPMWLASVGMTLPVFGRQSHALAETGHRLESEAQGEDATRQVVRLRARERHTLLASLRQTLDLYRGGLLVQSEAAVRSSLAQYQVGKVPFAAVLEVLRGVVADEGGYLDALAQAQRVAVAQREVSLEPAVTSGTRLASGSMPGTAAAAGGAMGAARAGAPSPGGGQEPAGAASGGMGGGM